MQGALAASSRPVTAIVSIHTRSDVRSSVSCRCMFVRRPVLTPE